MLEIDIKKLIESTEVDHSYRYNIEKLYEEKYEFIRANSSKVLDIGKSSREHYDKFLNSSWKGEIMTSDVNQFDGYPDIIDDICDTKLEKDYYDAVICNSVLEHVYDPKKAVENIYQIIKKDGHFIGQAPFLYWYHAPKDLKFQDYFRFSRDGLIYLFRDFSEVKLYAIRGRVSTPLSLFGFWKFKVEKYLGSVPSKILDKVSNSDTQVSGYVIWAKK